MTDHFLVLDEENDANEDFIPEPPRPRVPLNRQQEAAVELARKLVEDVDVGVVSGPAGTGKTTMLQETLAVVKGAAGVATPTGRAALRVRQQTGFPACTLHSLFYMPEEDEETGRVRFLRRTIPQLDEVLPRLLVIDEASMVGRELWADIQNVCQILNRSILLVGDGEQLPPVEMRKDVPPFSVFAPDFPVTTENRVTLTEVFRQALDSPILRAATTVRQARSWPDVFRTIRTGLQWLQHPLHEVSAHMRKSGQDHVVIAHRNATRLTMNHWIRYASGIQYGAPLQEGEPILVRRNNQDLGVYNGEIVPCRWVDEPAITLGKGTPWTFHIGEVNKVQCAINQSTLIAGNDDTIPRWCPASLADDYAKPFLRAHLGYVMTCHSAQGSEWPTVFVVVENSLHAMPEDDRRRWVYTALTRARTDVWLVQGS